MLTIAEGQGFTEGPRWHAGALWFSDFFTKGVYRAEPGGPVALVCEVAAAPSGLGFDPAGRLLVISMADRRLLRLQDGELVEHADLAAIAPGSLNDMVVGADGGAYVGNLGEDAALGAVLPPTPLIYVDPEGRSRPVGEPLYAPNGSVIADRGRTLLVAETLGARIVAFTIEADGELTAMRTWARLGPEPEPRGLFAAMRSGPVPDGIALDAEGAIWMGDAAGGGALRIAPGGEVLERVEVPGLFAYAVALGGHDGRTLFICAAPSLEGYRPFYASPEEVAAGGPGMRLGKVLAHPIEVPGAPAGSSEYSSI